MFSGAGETISNMLINKEEKALIMLVRQAGLGVRSVDQLTVISMLFLSFFFRLFLSSVLFQLALHNQSLKPLLSFLLLKSNRSSDQSYPDYFSVDWLSLVFELNHQQVKTSRAWLRLLQAV